MRSYDIWVDFNSVSPVTTTWTLVRHANIPLIAGLRLTAGDSEGNVCQARVLHVMDNIVELQLDMGTFDPAP
jgi:hypothetical protein